MAREGFHLDSSTFPGRNTFQKGEPRDVVYRLDYMIDHKDQENYLQLFIDAGWEHVGQMGGWQYFRKAPTAGEEPELFSDPESKAKKYQRILLFLVIFLPILIINLDAPEPGASLVMEILFGGLFVLFLLYAYVMVGLMVRITQLTKKG